LAQDVPAQPFLSVEGACLWSGARSIDWQICDGEQWALLGPNGSGKTALLRALAGHRHLAGGRVVYHQACQGSGADQVVLVEFGLERRFLGLDQPYYGSRWNSPGGNHVPLVCQFLAREAVLGLNPFRLGGLSGFNGDGADYQARLEEVACLLGIESLLARSLVQLSSGERRKVLLARALLRRPGLLLLDDPLTGLDEVYRPRLSEIITRLMDGNLRLVVAAPGWDGIPPGIRHVLDLTPGPSPQRKRENPNPGPSGYTKGEKLAGTLGPVLVQMEGASVRYGEVQVLSGVDWTVRAGERWVLLGPNGAGKTTLLSLILGDNPQAYANRMSLFGRRRGSGESIWEIKARIGWVAPELEDYIPAGSSTLDVACSGFFDSIGLHRPPTAGQRAAAGDLLEGLGLLPLAAAPFGGLSTGEKRAVLVARALVKAPALLVLDEPCQGMDAVQRERILALLDSPPTGAETALIYVTHDPLALPRCITHLLRLEAGRVVAREPYCQAGGELHGS
jgi:molybdate transport system ATP-binding protein